MARIHQYEAPDTPIRPSFRGYEAAMISGRRIAQIMKEGNADLTRGINSIGHAIDERERRQDKAEAKAERESIKEEHRQDKLESMREKAEARANKEEKEADKAQGLQESLRAWPEYTKLKAQHDAQLKQITQSTRPIDLPAALEKWRKETVEPDYAKLKEQYFTSKTGQEKADKWSSQGTAHIYGHVAGISQQAQGQAIVDQMNEVARHAEQDLLKNPEHLKDHLHQLDTQFKDVVSLMPQTAVNAVVPAGAGTGGVVQDQIATVLQTRGWTPAAIQGVLANVKAESNFDPGRINHAGGKEQGLYQFHPDTHLPLYLAQAGSDWKSVARQTEYMADYVEHDRSMANYKNSIDPAQATRDFMTGFERPKDQSPVAQEKRVANLGQMDFTGATMTPGKAAHMVEKARLELHRREVITAVHGVAAGDPDTGRPGNPAAAREMLKDKDLSQFLKPEDLDPLSRTSIARGIDNFEKIQNHQADLQLKSDTEARKDASQMRAADYINDLYGPTGKLQLKSDWTHRVMNDPVLRDEEKAALIGGKNPDGSDSLLKRLDAAYPQQRTDNRWNPSTPATTERPDEAPSAEAARMKSTGAMIPSFLDNAVAGLTKKPGTVGYVSPLDIINHIGVDLNGHDAAYLLKMVNPNNPFAQQELVGLENAMKKARDTLAPRNPDGSPNKAGEAAYNKFVSDYLIPNHRAAQAAGGGLSVLQPSSPDYMLKDNVLQRFAPGHKDITAAPEGMETPDLRSMLGPEPAAPHAAVVPEVHGTGAAPDPVPEFDMPSTL